MPARGSKPLTRHCGARVSDACFSTDGYSARAGRAFFPVAGEGFARVLRVRFLVAGAAEFEPRFLGSGCAGRAPAAASATAWRAIARALAKSLWWCAPQSAQVHSRTLRPRQPRGPVLPPQSKAAARGERLVHVHDLARARAACRLVLEQVCELGQGVVMVAPVHGAPPAADPAGFCPGRASGRPR